MNSTRPYNQQLKQLVKDNLTRLKISSPFGGHALHRNEAIFPFFIIGSGRCGTTLLRRILFAYPDICIPPETYVFPKCITLFQKYKNAPWHEIVHLILSTIEYHPKFIAFDISLRPLAQELIHVPKNKRSLATILDRFMRYYAKEKNLPCAKWGDKTPKNTWHLEAIHNVFPNSKYIHLIRHGADVVESYLRTGLHVGLEHSAKRWKGSIKKAQAFGIKHPNQYLEIHYETLVEQPQESLKKISDFLAIDYLAETIENSQKATNQMGDVTMYDHFSSVSKPVSTKHIGKWKEAFSDAEIKKLRTLIGPELESLGYQL